MPTQKLKARDPVKLTCLLIAATVLAVPAASLAQTTYTERHDINGRRGNQQQRIAQGAESGQLRPGETRHLEHQEHAIHHEERAMRSQDNGHLTASDRHTLARQQNAESRRIYRDKHNLRTDQGVPPAAR